MEYMIYCRKFICNIEFAGVHIHIMSHVYILQYPLLLYIFIFRSTCSWVYIICIFEKKNQPIVTESLFSPFFISIFWPLADDRVTVSDGRRCAIFSDGRRRGHAVAAKLVPGDVATSLSPSGGSGEGGSKAGLPGLRSLLSLSLSLSPCLMGAVCWCGWGRRRDGGAASRVRVASGGALAGSSSGDLSLSRPAMEVSLSPLACVGLLQLGFNFV